ncbi:MAG: hypothetical protein SFU27_11190 [Thermonemataceae bacterium]|nr:hypothetical protein [Thermonemataceae bacterium]
MIKFSVVILLFSMFFQEKHPIFHKYKDVIEEAETISIFEVAQNPTAQKEQDKAKQYIADYQVLKNIELKENLVDKFKKSILDKDNYIIEKKTCPFVAKYAISFKKKREHITLIISANTCEKVAIFSSHKSINETYHDLKAGNAIQAVLMELNP